MPSRRAWLRTVAGGICVSALQGRTTAAQVDRSRPPLKITGLKVTPIALPDPPLLAASGCHGPYFLRNIVQLETDAGVTGLGETRGGKQTTEALEKARPRILGRNAFAYRRFAKELVELDPGCYAGIELACLDACGRATGRRLCEMLGGPVRDRVEFAAYLFYRFAADHPKLLVDSRMVDGRSKGDKALDDWGEVRSPEAMVRAAQRFVRQWGFRALKLKAGVLPPDIELETMKALHAVFKDQPLRIDPNARWKVETAVRVGKALPPVEYYEDPVRGQEAMAEVRKATGRVMSTNMCVTRFSHVPDAVRLKPIDVVLCDHHYWGGMHACQELGRLAETLGWGLSQHSNNHAGVTMAAMIHLGAAVPHLTYAGDTHYPWLPPDADIIQGPKLAIHDGFMNVPEGPGLGVTLDLDKLARAHETFQKCGMRERDDAFTMRLIEPDWSRERGF